MAEGWQKYDLFQPTEEHALLRQTISSFVKEKVEIQALQYDREEKFNLELFKQAGSLGLLGITADPTYGGAGMDALSAVIVHEELSSSDPGFCLAYLAHTILCVHNISKNATEEQKKKMASETVLRGMDRGHGYVGSGSRYRCIWNGLPI